MSLKSACRTSSMVFVSMALVAVFTSISDAKKQPKLSIELDCTTIFSKMEHPSNAGIATASVDAPTGYTVTGGGCERQNTDDMGIELKNLPTSTGWTCSIGDAPGSRIDHSVKAYARVCKIKGQ